jgi:hypothetical protein
MVSRMSAYGWPVFYNQLLIAFYVRDARKNRRAIKESQ